MRKPLSLLVALAFCLGGLAPADALPLPVRGPASVSADPPVVEVASKRLVKKKKVRKSLHKATRQKKAGKQVSRHKSKRHAHVKARNRSKLPRALALIKKRLVQKKTVSDADLGKLAKAGDSMAAFVLAKRLTESGKPANLATAAGHYAAAVLAGRAYAARPLIDILRRDDVVLAPETLKLCEQALLKRSAAGDDVATRALFGMYMAGTPFGSRPDDAVALLENEKSRDDGQLAFDAANRLLAAGPDKSGRHDQAVRFLRLAAASPDLGRQIAAGNLLRQLGEDKSDGDQP